MYYRPLMRLQVFIRGHYRHEDTDSHPCVCPLLCLFPIFQGVNGVFQSGEWGAITKYQFNKEQIALPLSVSLFISCFLLNFFSVYG